MSTIAVQITAVSLISHFNESLKSHFNESLISHKHSESQYFRAQSKVFLSIESVSECAPLFMVKLGVQYSQFRQRFWNVLQYLTSN